MIYLVTAHFMLERADEYLTRLTDSTFKSQLPDGGEIVGAMNSVSSLWHGVLEYPNYLRGGSILDADQQSFK